MVQILFFGKIKKFLIIQIKLRKLESEIGQCNKNDINGYRELLKFSEKRFNVGFSKLSFTPFQNFWFMIKQVPSLLFLKSYLSVFKLVGKFIKNKQLRQALSIQPLLLGGNPITTTSIYNLIHYLERKWGVHYALGGTPKVNKRFRAINARRKK